MRGLRTQVLLCLCTCHVDSNKIFGEGQWQEQSSSTDYSGHGYNLQPERWWKYDESNHQSILAALRDRNWDQQWGGWDMLQFLVWKQVGRVPPNTSILHTMVFKSQKILYPDAQRFSPWHYFQKPWLSLKTTKVVCIQTWCTMIKNVPTAVNGCFDKQMMKHLHCTEFSFVAGGWLEVQTAGLALSLHLSR